MVSPMSPAMPVTLQINVAPTDLPHAVHTLPHQLRQFSGQVQEILFTYDLHRTERGGRFGEGWEERLQPMGELLERLCAEHPAARVEQVDYDPHRMRELARELFGPDAEMPVKDTKGAPFYPYFQGLFAARHEHVLHLDSDMMFGGGSQSWVSEAYGLLQAHEDVLACNPLAGPPRAGGSPPSAAQAFPAAGGGLRVTTMNTRLYLIDRSRMRERMLPMELIGPIRLVSRLKAKLHGNPPFGAAELVLGEAMRRAGLCRVDFPGEEPGLWSLHPPYRSPEFYSELPRLIEQVETGRIPEAQRGDYELGDAMLDWSRARRRARIRRIWA
jgi:hypothetical protein